MTDEPTEIETSGSPVAPDGVAYMDLQEFIDKGFLQEANRLFFHPRGLALAVDAEEGTMTIWDERTYPEGWFFVWGQTYDEATTHAKAETVEEQRRFHAPAREALYGGTGVQPLP